MVFAAISANAAVVGGYTSSQEPSNEARTTEQPLNDNLIMHNMYDHSIPSNIHHGMRTLSVTDFIIRVWELCQSLTSLFMYALVCYFVGSQN